MSRKSTGVFQQRELRERLRRLEREIAELKAVSGKDSAQQTAQQAASEEKLPDTTENPSMPKPS